MKPNHKPKSSTPSRKHEHKPKKRPGQPLLVHETPQPKSQPKIANKNTKSNHPNNELMTAVVLEDHRKLEALAKNKSMLDIPDRHGYTPLLQACATGREDIATMLMDAGANYAIKNKNGLDAVDLTIRLGNKVNIITLLKRVAKETESWEAVKYITAHKEDENVKSWLGSIHTHIAIAPTPEASPKTSPKSKPEEYPILGASTGVAQSVRTPSPDSQTAMYDDTFNLFTFAAPSSTLRTERNMARRHSSPGILSPSTAPSQHWEL